MVVEKLNHALDGMYVRAGTNLYKMADLTTLENPGLTLRAGMYANVTRSTCRCRATRSRSRTSP